MKQLYSDNVSVSIKDFIDHIFTGCEDDASPFVANSVKASVSSSLGRIGRGHSASAFYYTTSEYGKFTDGQVRRLRHLQGPMHVVVLDDIGSKIDPSRITLEPSYVIESSPGNYQYGYVLSKAAPAAIADRFMSALKARDPSITDLGACSPGRLVRLPKGINGKEHEITRKVNDFPVTLRVWDTSRLFTLDQLAAEWGLDLDAAPKVSPSLTSVPDGMLQDDIAELQVIKVLGDRVLAIEDGKAHINCPNKAAHSHDTGLKQTSLFIDINGHYIFKCLHESCFDFQFDMWMWEEQARALVTALPAEPVTGSSFTGIPDNTNGDRSDRDMLLEDIVVLRQKGFYNIARRTYNPNQHSLNMEYGHLDIVNANGQPILPTTILARASRKLTAEARCWVPDSGQFVDISSLTYVNTYSREQVATVDKPLLVNAWLKLVRHICGEHSDLVIDHMAYSIQHPGKKIRWQILVYGAPRTGKTLVFRPLVEAMQGNAGTVSADNMEAGWGNVYLHKKVLLVEEVFQYDRRMFNKLKTKLANSDFEQLNIKGESPVGQKNVYSMYMLTNHDDAIAMDVDEDKLLVLEAPASQLDRSVYETIGDNPDTPAAVYTYLRSRDVSKFCNDMLPVRTEAMVKMVKKAMTNREQLLEEMMEDGIKPFDKSIIQLDTLIMELRNMDADATRKSVSKDLRKRGYAMYLGQKKVEGTNLAVRFWGPVAELDGLTAAELYAVAVRESHAIG